jgi:hypothetical protein
LVNSVSHYILDDDTEWPEQNTGSHQTELSFEHLPGNSGIAAGFVVDARSHIGHRETEYLQ